ncbi:MAG: DUF4158 domain-containing protein [Shewanella sp.]|nr:DUF4158 domain-containing protein [Shewanella sp.]
MERQGRIQILTTEEIEQLYEKPIFGQKEREEFFSLDESLFSHVKSISKLENQLYFILTIGYFRYKPVITQFDLKDAKDDIQYICELYFSGAKLKLQPIPSSTHFRLTNQVVNLLGFRQINSELQTKLENRLQDVATISIDPRYMFDESIAFFGQERIALAGYSSIQKIITKVLSDERKRVESILSKQMTKATAKTLQIILRDKKRLNTLSNYKGSARGFNASELDKELNTHAEIKPIYPELKKLIEELKLSRGNMRYYASIVQYRSVYKLRRMSKWQAILYLMCYLYYRYRENNDRLVTAFRYLVTKHLEARRLYAKEAIADELEIVRSKLKHAGGILNLFVDEEIDDQIEFGQIRKQAFDFVKKSDVQLLSKYRGLKPSGTKTYAKEYISVYKLDL